MTLEKSEERARKGQEPLFRPLSADIELPAEAFGGKASQLAELMRLGANVPAGIALAAGFFERLGQSAGLNEQLQALRLEPSPERATARARQLILETEFDDALFDPLV